MSFHGQRLRQLRARAGLDPLPESIYMHAFVARFEESIDPRFYSPATRHWYDSVCDHVATGALMPASEREAFRQVGYVLNMARDERDEERRRRSFMPSAKEQSDFEGAQYHRAAELTKTILLEKEMRRRGYSYGPDSELPDGVTLPSMDGLFDRAMAAQYRQTQGAVHQKRLRWRAAHGRLVRAGP